MIFACGICGGVVEPLIATGGLTLAAYVFTHLLNIMRRRSKLK